MLSIPVKFSGEPRTDIDAEVFASWFPGAFVDWRHIDGDSWVNSVYDSIRCYCRWSRLERRDVRKCLWRLFRRLEHIGYNTAVDSGSRIRRSLEESLHNGNRGNIHVPYNPGLSRVRHDFIILAEVAYSTNSQLLAEALDDFITRNGGRIGHSNREPFEYIRSEWEPAILKVQEIRQANRYGLDDMFGYPRWGYRRQYHDDWNYRSSSAPPVRRRRSVDLQLARTNFGLIARPPPMMSPAHMITASPFDDVDALVLNQAKIEHEIQDVKRDLRMMQYDVYR